MRGGSAKPREPSGGARERSLGAPAHPSRTFGVYVCASDEPLRGPDIACAAHAESLEPTYEESEMP